MSLVPNEYSTTSAIGATKNAEYQMIDGKANAYFGALKRRRFFGATKAVTC